MDKDERVTDTKQNNDHFILSVAALVTAKGF